MRGKLWVGVPLEESKHRTINTYKWTNVGQTVSWVWWKVREGLQMMGSFQGYNMRHYSQQDLIDSGLGGGKASSDKGEEKSGHNLTIWLLCFFVSWPFFLLSFLGHVCCSFCAFLRNQGRDWDDARQNENKRKNSQLVLKILQQACHCLPHFIFFLPLFFPNAEPWLWNMVSFSSNSVCSSFPLPFEFLSALTGGWMEGKEVSGCWVPLRQAHPL